MKKAITLIIILALNLNLKACSCFGPDNFCESLFPGSQIVIVEILEFYGEFELSFNARIEEVITGEVDLDFISVNHTYTTCTDFPLAEVGDRLIINLGTISPQGDAEYPQVELNGCIVQFLYLENDMVRGSITERETSFLNLGQFISELSSCADLRYKTENLRRYIRMFNNPGEEQLMYNIFELPVEEINIEIFDVAGRKVASHIIEEESLNSINISSLHPGIYICVFLFRESYIPFKFVKA